MLYFPVSVAYTVTNYLLALIIYLKSHKNQITRFYFFCVNCLVALGISSYILTQTSNIFVYSLLENIVLFLYALFPFFFIHFITFFVRQKDILKSAKLNYAIYAVGLFSYAVLLLGFIPKPISDGGLITPSGYIFYVTWMSVFFSIGIAMLFEISREFRHRAWKANFIFISFIFLLLILPGPFTDSLFFGVFRLSVEWYFYLCTIALLMSVYFIFRHKINVNPVSDALKSAIEVMNDVFITTDEFFTIELIRGKTVWNILGYKEQDLIGKSLVSVIDQKDYLDRYRDYVLRSKMRESYFDADLICKGGNKVPMNFSLTPLFLNDELTGFVCMGRDMTDHKRLENELRHAQKIESLGTLAGGIAHDFNNILQIVLVNTSSMKRGIPDAKKLEQIIEINTSAIKRGSKLVQQILTFARKTEVQFNLIDINNVIQDLVKLLIETFPRTVRFSMDLMPQIPHVLGDPNQLNQVLMNLCVNARDAMPEGGTISVHTDLVMGWELKKKFSDAKEDRYVCLRVTDTGNGMDHAVRERIFEPFFTTKEPGKGTGLGLSVVYGIVTSHRGFIDVASDIGVGTTFSICLPVSLNHQKVSVQTIDVAPELPQGTETLLVVEDEDILLQSISTLLTAQGYRVIPAKDGLEAVEMFKKHHKDISLVVMDIGLPKLSGWDALDQIKQVNHSVKTIVSSGYLDPKIKSEKMLDVVSEFINKPYDPNMILKSIRRVLDARK